MTDDVKPVSETADETPMEADRPIIESSVGEDFSAAPLPVNTDDTVDMAFRSPQPDQMDEPIEAHSAAPLVASVPLQTSEPFRPARPIFRRLVNAVLGREDFMMRAVRLRDLTRAIERAPDAPGNYVLRGELYLASKEYDLARADFEQALELATAQVEHNNWGLLAQALRDRALAGLARLGQRH